MLGSSATTHTGIHVGGDAVYAVELTRRRGLLSLTHCSLVGLDDPPQLPEQLVDDDGRRILADALRQLKGRGLRGRRPYFALSGTATFVKRRFALPEAEADTRDHLLWEARQLLEEDLDDYVVDVLVTRRYGFVIAARRQILELYGVLCKEAGVEAPRFDMASFALCNALEASGAAAGEGAELIVHGDGATARAVLLREGEYEAETVWAHGVDDTQSLAEKLSRLCEAELDEGERARQLWLTGPVLPADGALLANLADEVADFDPFADVSRSAAAEEGLMRSGREECAFAVAAGLAYRSLAED